MGTKVLTGSGVSVGELVGEGVLVTWGAKVDKGTGADIVGVAGWQPASMANRIKKTDPLLINRAVIMFFTLKWQEGIDTSSISQ